MKFHWLKLVLLASFAFWATGAAKFTHEMIEHHGQDASIDDGDDDSSVATSTAPDPARHDEPRQPVKHPCAVCQMLAGMAVERTTPPLPPTTFLPLVETLVLTDHAVPVATASIHHSARGPPNSL